MTTSRAPLALAGCLWLAGCAVAQAPTPPAAGAPPHHTAQGFRNPHIGAVDKPLADLLRWRWEAWRDGLPRAPQRPTPTASPDLAAIQSHAEAARTGSPPAPQLTWIGHASMLVQAGGLNVLTDPIFSERASPLSWIGPRRAQPPGLTPAQLPPIDVVLISHNHYDHLDRPSLLALEQRAVAAGGRTLFLVPLGNGRLLRELGLRDVVELDWWQSHAVRGVEFHCTPVQHWSARGLNDRNQALWSGWAVLGPALNWYFSGDAGYSRDFADTRERLAARLGPAGGFDLALLPVGAYEPRWFMAEQHVSPEEAVRAHLDLRARLSIGIHWGTFELTDEPLDQPPQDLALARDRLGVAASAFGLMAVGETRRLAPPAR